MKTCVAAAFVAILFTCGTGFSWGRLFRDGEELTEAPAQALEVGEASTHHSHQSRLKKLSSSKTKASDQPTFAAEKPLPEDSAVETGHLHGDDPTASKQIIEAALAGVGEGSNTSSPSTMPEKQSVVPPVIDGKENGQYSDEGYPTIKKEIEDMSKKIGPVKDDSEVESSTSGVREESHSRSMSKDDDEGHSTLTQGIEQAIAGLTSVYNTLRSNETKDSFDSRQTRQKTDPIRAKHSEASEMSDVQSSLVTGGAGRSNVERKASASEIMQPADAGDKFNSSSSSAITDDHFNSSTPTNSTGSDYDSFASSSADKDDKVSKKSGGGISPVVVLGGIALIAAVAVFAMNYSQNQDTATAPSPLYPPRGPSYV